MARHSTWLLLAALVLAAACTATAQHRRLTQTEGPYDDVAAAAAVLEVQKEVVAQAHAASSLTKTVSPSSTFKGPSTTVDPYIVPERCDVTTTSVLTVGDNIGGYRLVGIPDGLGAYQEEVPKRMGKRQVMVKNEDEFVLLANHELGATAGVRRAHGGGGAFVSKWWIDARTLAVKKGEDLIKDVFLWDWNTNSYAQNTAYNFSRFCSADLPDPDAFAWGPFGTKERIFTNGEEVDGGKGFAHVVTGPHAGKSYHLPLFGTDSWENLVACPHSRKTTLVMGLDDGGGNHQAVYAYVGEKKFNPRGNMHPVEAAGLQNGKLYCISVKDFPAEDFLAMPPNGQKTFEFSLVDVTPGTLAPTNDAGFQTYVADPIRKCTSFARPEDGSWDPDTKSDFYFLTTANLAGVTKMWRLRFDDVKNPLKGGSASIIVNGLAGPDSSTPNQAKPVMMDNLVVHKGYTYMQEDPGGRDIVGRIWSYGIKDKTLEVMAKHDPALYDPTLPGNSGSFVTPDEESSGIISLDGLLRGRKDCFMVAQQTHLKLTKAQDPNGELIEGGQLVLVCKDARKCTK